MSDLTAEELLANLLRADIMRLTERRENLLPSDACLNCGSRIFQEPEGHWLHRSGSTWCDPQQAQPMAGRVLTKPERASDVPVPTPADEGDA